MNRTQEKEALLWGLVGVTLFAATLPMTRLAVGSTDAPQLSPWFVTFGRAAVAGLLSIGYLLWQRAQGRLNLPVRAEWPLLGITAFGVIVGFPLFLALALRHVPSTHGAVVTALLPLSTALLGALWYRQRPSAGFWACAVLGSGLVDEAIGISRTAVPAPETVNQLAQHSALGEVLAGRVDVARRPDDITVFDMTGLALQDLTTARLLFERACEHDLGTRIPWPW